MSRKREYQPIEAPETLLHAAPSLPEGEAVADSPTRFYGQFADCMEMYADTQTVASYLNSHQGWFCRCAQPMKVEPLGKNGYALAIGRFGSFGYEVEPKVGLELLPPDKGVYRIKTIPVPNYVAPGYEVNFESTMHLVATPADLSNHIHAGDGLRSEITRVEWQLDLTVHVQFPKFIQRLPKSLVQSTGDRLLHQIVRQVSRRLTYRVQEDFHKSLGLPFPPNSASRQEKGKRVEGQRGRGAEEQRGRGAEGQGRG